MVFACLLRGFELHFGFQGVRVNAVLLFRHESIIPAADKRKRRLLQLHVNRSQIQANLESTTARIAILPENQD